MFVSVQSQEKTLSDENESDYVTLTKIDLLNDGPFFCSSCSINAQLNTKKT